MKKLIMVGFLSLSLVFVLVSFFSCKDRKLSRDYQRDLIGSDQGVSSDKLDLIYKGPRGFDLVHFPRQVIQLAHVSKCEVIEKDSASEKVTRTVWFDANGNIIKDENRYFQWWFHGTVVGIYTRYYNSSNNLLKTVSLPEKGRADSAMTIYSYTQNGLLHSKDECRFTKRIKPGADRHIPRPGDFETYPTWNRIESYKFSFKSDTVMIETVLEGKTTNKEKYVLQFDALSRLTAVTKYTDTVFNEVINYKYTANSITGNLLRIMSDGEEWKYNTMSVIDDRKNQVQKILFDEHGSVGTSMVITYNADGTIGNIKYKNKYSQSFKYAYY